MMIFLKKVRLNLKQIFRLRYKCCVYKILDFIVRIVGLKLLKFRFKDVEGYEE